MKLGKGDYFSALKKDVLDRKPVDNLLAALKSHLTVEKVPPELFQQNESQAKITKKLSRLTLRVVRGPKSWGGLVIGFPGSGQQLTTETLGTPYLREILYPALDLHQRVKRHYKEQLPCLYLLGVRFPETVLRKFRLLQRVIPHVIVLTSDLLRDKPTEPPELPSKVDEQWTQVCLRRKMMSDDGLRVPVKDEDIRLAYLSHELSTGEGTARRERLDILGVDKADKSLVAFEIKGPDCGRVDLENLFLQGLDHREWLELNKMAIKFAFDGPRGGCINTRKRVRLLLGFFNDEAPDLFWELRRQAMQDPYMKIDFVHFAHTGGSDGELILTRMDEPKSSLGEGGYPEET